MSPPQVLCALCGVNEATTRDHVPPRAIFPKPRPALVTVPACLPCNLKGSKHDEAFRVYLSLHVGIDSEASSSLFTDGALRTLSHNQRLRDVIVGGARKVRVMTPAGIYAGTATGVLWDSKAHDAVIERTLRGLYYHHYEGILGGRAKIKVQWIRSIPNDIATVMKDSPLVRIGDGQFSYRRVIAADQPLSTIWLFSFYDRHLASGYTLPAEG